MVFTWIRSPNSSKISVHNMEKCLCVRMYTVCVCSCCTGRGVRRATVMFVCVLTFLCPSSASAGVCVVGRVQYLFKRS